MEKITDYHNSKLEYFKNDMTPILTDNHFWIVRIVHNNDSISTFTEIVRYEGDLLNDATPSHNFIGSLKIGKHPDYVGPYTIGLLKFYECERLKHGLLFFHSVREHRRSSFIGFSLSDKYLKCHLQK